MAVILSMTDEEVVRKAAALIGAGAVRADKRRVPNPKWNSSWTWRDGNAETVVRLIDNLQPLMSSRRQAKMTEIREVALAWIRRGKRTHGTRLTYERGCRCDRCLVAKAFDDYFALVSGP